MTNIPKEEWTDIEKLTPYENNPKKHPEEQIERLANSIKNYGWKEDIVADKDLVIISGHGRLKAAKKLGFEKVPVDVANDLTKEEAAQLRIIANKVGDTDYKDQRMAQELDKLRDGDEYDKMMESMDNGAVSEYLDKMTDDEDLEEPETEDPEQVETDITKGEVFKLGRHRLMCGDATNKEHVKKLMDGKEAAITFTSPPYNAGKSEELSGNTNMDDNKYDEYDDDKEQSEWKKLVQNSLDLIKKHSQHQFYNIQQLAGNKTALIKLLYDNRKHFTDTIIWDKQNAAPAMQEKVLNSRFEYIHIFSSQKNAKRTIRTANFRGSVDNVYAGNPQKNNEFSNVHAATFPIDFPEWVIKNFTQREDIVIDNFAGTGTTLLAAEQTNRKAFCMELDPQYCQVIINRWEELTGKKAEPIQ